MFCPDAFEERAAIMEYDGGLSRFDAETRAAQEQGKTRWEALGEIGKRLVAEARDHRAANEWHGSDNVPGMQPHTQEKN